LTEDKGFKNHGKQLYFYQSFFKKNCFVYISYFRIGIVMVAIPEASKRERRKHLSLPCCITGHEPSICKRRRRRRSANHSAPGGIACRSAQLRSSAGTGKTAC